MTFKVVYTETIEHCEDIECGTKEEAESRFWDLVEQGKVDLLDSYMCNSHINVIEV